MQNSITNQQSTSTPSEAAADDAALEVTGPDPSASMHGMLGSAAVVGFFTLLSRITGLLRFRVMGHFFGASRVADAFNLAFIFPNLTRRLFGEGLLTNVFVPVFSGQLAKDQKTAANRTASVLLIRLGYWLSAGCVVCIALSAGIRLFLAGPLELTPGRILEFRLFEALLPYCVLINVAAVLMAILNSLGHFWIPAFAPVLLNAAIIGACYFGLERFGALPEQQIWAVALAVLLGGVLQLLIQLPPAYSMGFRFKFTNDKSDPGYREVMDNFKPVALMVAVFQLNVLMDNLIAQKFIPGDGPVTYMNMGTSVYQFAWSVIALAIGVAALPILSRQWAQNDKPGFNRSLNMALRYALFAAIPCTVGAMLLSDDIVRMLYGTGRFLANDGEPVRRTAGVVFFSCLGLVFYSVNAIQVRALYAMKDMRTPTRTMLHAVILNFGLNLFFVLVAPKISAALFPAVSGWAGKPGFENDAFNAVGLLGGLRESGIILAGTISTAWQTWALSKALRRDSGSIEEPALNRKFFLLLVGSTLGAALLGLSVYRRQLAASHDDETLFAFVWGVAAFLVPLIGLNYWYFDAGRKQLRARLKLRPEDPIPDEHLTEAHKLQHALFTSIAAAAIMGLAVWCVRESLPPEGRNFQQTAQRALAPVLAGILAYGVASSALMSREYEELWGLLWRRRGVKS